MLYDYLLEAFDKNEPIFLSDIRYKDYSDIWLKKELAKLCDSDQIIRYERGIYYKRTALSKLYFCLSVSMLLKATATLLILTRSA